MWSHFTGAGMKQADTRDAAPEQSRKVMRPAGWALQRGSTLQHEMLGTLRKLRKALRLA
jgi:hypothetical protein